MTEIQNDLLALQDLKYREFHSKLMPGVEKEKIIGVRTPDLRRYGKLLYRERPRLAAEFIRVLPHRYYEENNLHGILIGLMADDPREALDMIDELLPYVDNWATCDMLPPKIFSKDPETVRNRIEPWLDSPEVYRVRFAVVTLLGYFLEEEFKKEDLFRLASIHREEYYIRMAIAWYYSFALIKQYEATIPLFREPVLDRWIHNKSIQKACESYRIDKEKKAYLKSLKRKGEK